MKKRDAKNRETKSRELKRKRVHHKKKNKMCICIQKKEILGVLLTRWLDLCIRRLAYVRLTMTLLCLVLLFLFSRRLRIMLLILPKLTIEHTNKICLVSLMWVLHLMFIIFSFLMWVTIQAKFFWERREWWTPQRLRIQDGLLWPQLKDWVDLKQFMLIEPNWIVLMLFEPLLDCFYDHNF